MTSSTPANPLLQVVSFAATAGEGEGGETWNRVQKNCARERNTKKQGWGGKVTTKNVHISTQESSKKHQAHYQFKDRTNGGGPTKLNPKHDTFLTHPWFVCRGAQCHRRRRFLLLRSQKRSTGQDQRRLYCRTHPRRIGRRTREGSKHRCRGLARPSCRCRTSSRSKRRLRNKDDTTTECENIARQLRIKVMRANKRYKFWDREGVFCNFPYANRTVNRTPCHIHMTQQ